MTDNTSAKKEKGSFFKNLKLEFKKIIWPDTKDVAKKGNFFNGNKAKNIIT